MNQKGYTLIELLVMLPISVVILAAIVGAIFMVMHGGGDLRRESTALTDIENAAHYLNRDVIMGQNIWRTWNPITGQGEVFLEGAEPVDEMRTGAAAPMAVPGAM